MDDKIIVPHWKWFLETGLSSHRHASLQAIVHIHSHIWKPQALLLHLTLLFERKPNNVVEPLWSILSLPDMKCMNCPFLVFWGFCMPSSSCLEGYKKVIFKQNCTLKNNPCLKPHIKFNCKAIKKEEGKETNNYKNITEDI